MILKSPCKHPNILVLLLAVFLYGIVNSPRLSTMSSMVDIDRRVFHVFKYSQEAGLEAQPNQVAARHMNWTIMKEKECLKDLLGFSIKRFFLTNYKIGFFNNHHNYLGRLPAPSSHPLPSKPLEVPFPFGSRLKPSNSNYQPLGFYFSRQLAKASESVNNIVSIP